MELDLLGLWNKANFIFILLFNKQVIKWSVRKKKSHSSSHSLLVMVTHQKTRFPLSSHHLHRRVLLPEYNFSWLLHTLAE